MTALLLRFRSIGRTGLLASAGLALSAPALAQGTLANFWSAFNWPEEPEEAVEALDRRVGEWAAASGNASWLATTEADEDLDDLDRRLAGVGRALHGSGMAAIARLSTEDLSDESRRKLLMLQHRSARPLGLSPGAEEDIDQALSSLSRSYAEKRVCIDSQTCVTLQGVTAKLRATEDFEERRRWWLAAATAVADMAGGHEGSARLLNQAARDLGYGDLNGWRRAHFEQSDIDGEFDRLWHEVRPLYALLACHVRERLSEKGGAEAGEAGLIPEHWLGDLSSRQWSHLHGEVRGDLPPRADLTPLLAARFSDPVEMARFIEGEYVAAGFPHFPKSFWERSRFTRPARDDVRCPRSGYNVDWRQDIRVAVCGEVDESTFRWLNQIYPFLYYDLAFTPQDWVFRDPPHLAFHFANAGAFDLSLTSDRLYRIGLLPSSPREQAELSRMLDTALAVLPEIARTHSIDRWRSNLQSGAVPWEQANAHWWRVRGEVEGIGRPGAAAGAGFDAGLHPYIMHEVDARSRFLGKILQFQWLSAACRRSGFEGPLHHCSLFEDQEAGQRLWPVLALGSSEPAPVVLERLTGSRGYSAADLRTYFRPLEHWLEARVGTCSFPGLMNGPRGAEQEGGAS